jgi:quinol-cytochrome oxidoreductase complex cytochrome b subunit
MLLSILILAALPWLHSTEIRSSRFRPIYKFFYWTLISCCLLLGWIGGMPVEDPYILIGQILSFFYFFYFVVLIPSIGKLEKLLLNVKLF